MGSTTTFCSFRCSLRPLSLNSALGVKVGSRAAVFYGFSYKLRPKPKIALELSLPIASFSGSGFGLGTSLLGPILEPKYFVGSLIPRLSPSKWNEAKCLKVCYGGLLTPPPGLSAVDSEQQS